ncbi:MAG: hypothetical protein CM1200mP16_04460 [Nitrospina sp.]|nr:MAG: hypothetical protein CM1200mP16_04460 [Nitrospina sp.]
MPGASNLIFSEDEVILTESGFNIFPGFISQIGFGPMVHLSPKMIPKLWMGCFTAAFKITPLNGIGGMVTPIPIGRCKNAKISKLPGLDSQEQYWS